MRTFADLLNDEESKAVAGALVLMARAKMGQVDMIAIVQGLLAAGYRCGKREACKELEATMGEVRAALGGKEGE